MQVMAFRLNGDTSNIERVFLYKDSGATAGTEGDPFTGLTNSSTGLNISTIAHNEAAPNTDTSAATSSIETVSTLGTYSAPTAGFVRFREVDATDMPGLYELQWEDARYAVSSAIWLDVTISGVADLAPFHGRIYTNRIPADATLVAGAVTDASLAGGLEIVFETDFGTNYNVTRNAWATNLQDQVGTGNLTADVIAISGDTTAADNLELMYDTTGYTDATAPASRSQIQNISTVGAAVHISPIASPNGFTITTGSEVNNEDATVPLDGTRHELSDAAGTLDALYKFDIGGDAAPVSVTFTGIYNGGDDDFIISGNTGTDATPVWVQMGTLEGVNNTNFTTVHTFNMFNNMIVTDVAGQVQVRINNTGLTSSSFDTDQVFVSKSDTSRSVGYANGQVWLDTVNGVAGTESFVNGVADNPTNLIASAKTIATNIGLADFHIINGSTVLLAESTVNESYFGDNWILQLGTQDVAGAYFQGAEVSGVATSASEVHYEGCDCNTMSVQIGHFDFCSFSGTVTQTLTGDYNYHNCYSKVPGSGGPTFAKTAGQTVTAQWRNWSGSINITGLELNDTLTIGGRMGTIDLGSPAAAAVVEIRGTYKEITNAGSAAINLVGAILAADVAAILVDTDATIPGLIADVPTVAEFNARTIASADYFDPAADAVANVTLVATTTTNTDLVSAAAVVNEWETQSQADPTGFHVNVLEVSGTAEDLPTATALAVVDANVDQLELGIIFGVAETGTLSTTQATSDLTGFTDDQLIGRVIIFTAGPADGEATDITDYASASGLLTFTALTLAPENGNAFKIV